MLMYERMQEAFGYKMFNPTRRNKNIGKTQGGRVKDGRAYEKWSHVFSRDIWTRLSESNEKLQVLRENPSRNLYHPCGADEYLEVLKQLPDEYTKNVKAIVLRRTTKSHQKLCVEACRKYHCVIMNAFPKNNEMIWTSKPDNSCISRHYDSWCRNWLEEDGVFKLVWSVEELKRYFLYHLFLHEIGHINQPWSNSLKKRESFAENFALEWARKLDII